MKVHEFYERDVTLGTSDQEKKGSSGLLNIAKCSRNLNIKPD